MKACEQVFFSLLRSGMWGVPAEVPEGFDDWEGVVWLAKAQSMLGVVGDVMLSDERIADSLSSDTKGKLRSFLMSNMMTHAKLNSVLAHVVSSLRGAGVPSVLLKGQGLAAYYPKPELRQCGDIDLYVGQENYSKAYDILKPLASKIDDRKAMDIGKHYDVCFGRITVEVHRYCGKYPFKKRDDIFQAASKEGLSHGLVWHEIGGVRVDTPSDTFNAFYVFDHLFHHFLTSGIGFRQICDWMRFLHIRHENIDVDALGKLIGEMGLMEPWKAFGCMLVDVLGMPSEEFPLYDSSYRGKAAPVVRRILEEGNFGKERGINKNRGRVYLINKTRSFFGHIGRTFRMTFLFPSQALSFLLSTLKQSFAIVWRDARIRFGKKSE